MSGDFIDHIYYRFNRKSSGSDGCIFLDTDYGKIRLMDTGGQKPVIINVPDGPNVIEHHDELIRSLSSDFRVICFEYPGLGLSYPNARFRYSMKDGAALLLQVIDALGLNRPSLLFSCSNGFYALKAAETDPAKFDHIFLAQTPSLYSMSQWAQTAIPGILKKPLIGQTVNALSRKKLSHTWYQYALPKESPHREAFRKISMDNLGQGGCFCLSGLVQGMKADMTGSLSVNHPNITLVWGKQDFSHRRTEKETILEHAANCEIIEFDNCGHFPELERTTDFVRLIRERRRN